MCVGQGWGKTNEFNLIGQIKSWYYYDTDPKSSEGNTKISDEMGIGTISRAGQT